MYTIHFRFTDAVSDVSEINVDKRMFLDGCEEKNVRYFIAMLKDFKESTESSIIVDVPYASVMESIVADIINELGKLEMVHSTMAVIKRIYCLDFFGMEFTKDFEELTQRIINNEVYDLVHRFIDQKGYDNELYIKLLAEKLPNNYDLSEFPKELLKSMLNVTRRNFIVLHSDQSELLIYDSDINDYHSHLSEIDMYCVNPVRPIIAGIKMNKLVLYYILSVCETNPIYLDTTPQLVSFSADGKYLYMADNREVQIFDIDTFLLVGRYKLVSDSCFYEPIHLLFAPDGNYLAFYHWRTTTNNDSMTWHILNMSNGEINEISKEIHTPSYFVNKSTLVFNSGNNDVPLLYDCETNTIRDSSFPANYRPDFSKGKRICHPHKNIVIEYVSDDYNCCTLNDTKFNGIVTCLDNETIPAVNIYTLSDMYHSCTNASFSSNGKSIYTISYQYPTTQVTKYCFHKRGTISLQDRFEIKSMSNYYKEIRDISYVNQDILGWLQLAKN